MSDIGAVVARSRLPGEFSERRTFTLARTRAIQKMRQFALADPYYFVLELIQAAVANGATYINVATDDSSFTLSYTRGFFREEELGQLFDFLFAGKDRADIGHVRELALGINALLLFKPDRIVVESGDGTPQGTTRMVVNKNAEHVDIGRSKLALSGTYIRAENISRWAVRKMTSLEPAPGMPMEAAAIEERCLTAPIPVLVNDQPLFGYSTHRIPRLLGYRRTIEFDEGDLFGSLGVHPLDFTPSFKLLTYGVWIQSVSYELLSGVGVGGIVCFDRLRKTADHSGIVNDDVWKEMWARLKPYADKLHSGASGEIRGEVTLLSGAVLNARELRPLIRGCEHVVLVAPTVEPSSAPGVLAHEIGVALDGLVIKANAADEAWLRGLAGGEVSLLRPNLGDDQDHAFFAEQQVCEVPARPWLAPPVAVASIDLDTLVRGVAQLFGAQSLRATEADAPQAPGASADRPAPAQGAADEETAAYHERLADEAQVRQAQQEASFVLGGAGQVSATVYTPAEPPSTTRLTVQLITVDRLVCEFQLPSAYPGHVLRVELPDASPSRLHRPLGGQAGGPSLAQHLARVLVVRAMPALRAAAAKALAHTPDHAGSGAAVLRSIALAALSRSLVSRFQMDEAGVPRIRFSLVEGAQASALLDRPILPTLSGSWASMRDLERTLAHTGGLVYGVVPSVPPALDGLAPSHILKLDEEEEQLLISLLGDAAYVRVDRRDVLAEHRGLQCRDMALGLRRYPDFPLLVEGADPTPWPTAEQQAAVQALVVQLASCFLGLDPARPADPTGLTEWEENRRHACRHLQWFICHHAARGMADEPHYDVGELPLFLDPAGQAWTFDEVAESLRGPEGLRLCFRPAFRGSQLGALTAAAATSAQAARRDQTLRELATSPLTALLLSGLGNIGVALDFELPHETAPAAPDMDGDYLQRCEVTGPGYHGHVGLPAASTGELQIYVLEPSTGALHAHRQTARAYGMVGLVRLAEGSLSETLGRQITDELRAAGEKLVTRLAGRLASLPSDSERYHQSVRHLLAFAGARLQLFTTSELQPIALVRHPVAQQVLAMPLFPTVAGPPISGNRLIDAFCTFGSVLPVTEGPQVEGRQQVTLAPDAPDYLQQWVRGYLNESRVVRPASGRSAPLPAVLERADRPTDERVALSVEHWLEELRPDRLGDPDAERLPIRVLIRSGAIFANFTQPHELMAYTYFERIPTALLNGDHWLVTWARDRLDTDPYALSALLLACYAHINAVLDPVTNLHERVFQVHLAEALEAGRLTPQSLPESDG